MTVSLCRLTVVEGRENVPLRVTACHEEGKEQTGERSTANSHTQRIALIKWPGVTSALHETRQLSTTRNTTTRKAGKEGEGGQGADAASLMLTMMCCVCKCASAVGIKRGEDGLERNREALQRMADGKVE